VIETTTVFLRPKNYPVAVRHSTTVRTRINDSLFIKCSCGQFVHGTVAIVEEAHRQHVARHEAR
jgi:hypothetical protein